MSCNPIEVKARLRQIMPKQSLFRLIDYHVSNGIKCVCKTSRLKFICSGAVIVDTSVLGNCAVIFGKCLVL